IAAGADTDQADDTAYDDKGSPDR
ncbi:MAG: hypothetical protein QOH80_677, partial [Actinomycetota bacterium]|nr:hypothetical protein [Actinomycetota bacterium]